MTNSDDPTDEDLQATIEAGITQADEDDKSASAEPVRCPFCGEERLVECVNDDTYYCAVCARSFLPPADAPLTCPYCQSELVLPREGQQPYYCTACRRRFTPRLR